MFSIEKGNKQVIMANTKVTQEKVVVPVPNRIARRILRKQNLYGRVPKNKNLFTALRIANPSMYLGLISKLRRR